MKIFITKFWNTVTDDVKRTTIFFFNKKVRNEKKKRNQLYFTANEIIGHRLKDKRTELHINYCGVSIFPSVEYKASYYNVS